MSRSPLHHALTRITRAGLLAALWVAAPAAADGALVGRVVRIADGDTLTVARGDERIRVRLHEIDAPEQRQPWSREARRALADKVDGRYVRIEVDTVDDYGRTVGKVWLGNRDVNRELVREGHAWAYRHYLKDESLLADEAAARASRVGLWSLPDPTPPWQWRQQARADASEIATTTPGRCSIKGNISRRGERIYHRPGDRHYARTRIDPAAGERWFCSVAEAERAGWRAAR